MTPTWTPKWRHVSQIFAHYGDAPGSQDPANDCFEASCARWLRETDVPYQGADQQLIADLRQDICGYQDSCANQDTTVDQINAWLGKININPQWVSVTDNPDVANEPWALSLVSLLRLDPLPCPESWLGGVTDKLNHFVLNLPSGLVNDPLAVSDEDTPYTIAVMCNATALPYGGALLLPAPSTFEWTIENGEIWATPNPPPGPPPALPNIQRAQVKMPTSLAVGPGVATQADWLKHDPKAQAPGITQLKPSEQVEILNWINMSGPLIFQRVAVPYQGNRLEAWVLQTSVKAGANAPEQADRLVRLNK